MNMLSFGDRNLPIDGNAVRGSHGCLLNLMLPRLTSAGVCSAHWDVPVLLAGGVTILTGGGRQDGALSITWSHHTAPGMGISQEEVSGSAAATLLCSLPVVLACVVSWCSHSSEARVPVCWEALLSL